MFSKSRNQAKFIALLATSCIAAVGSNAFAQAYPARPITLISPVTAGGTIDIASRNWMACAEELAGQPIVLLNRPGANGVVAANALKLAAPDGYTFMVAGMSQTTITPFGFKKQPYDPEEDFHGVALFGDTPMMLVASPQSGIKSLTDLKKYASSRPEGIDIGHQGVGHTGHILSAAIVSRLGVKNLLVPYSGETAAATAVMAGEVQAMVIISGSAMPFVESGKMVPLMALSQDRLPEYPNVPTVVEELDDPSLARKGWMGITARKGTPQAAIDAVESWTRTCMDNPAFKRSLEQAMFTPYFVPQKEYAGVVRRDIEFWKPWIDRLNIRNE